MKGINFEESTFVAGPGKSAEVGNGFVCAQTTKLCPVILVTRSTNHGTSAMRSHHALMQIFPKGTVRNQGDTAGGFFEVVGLRRAWTPESCLILATCCHPGGKESLSRRASYLIRTRDDDVFFHVCKDSTKFPSEFAMGHVCAIADDIRGPELRRDALRYISQIREKFSTFQPKALGLHQSGIRCMQSPLSIHEIQDFPWLLHNGVPRQISAQA
jgi:hypothetical protein